MPDPTMGEVLNVLDTLHPTRVEGTLADGTAWSIITTRVLVLPDCIWALREAGAHDN